MVGSLGSRPCTRFTEEYLFARGLEFYARDAVLVNAWRKLADPAPAIPVAPSADHSVLLPPLPDRPPSVAPAGVCRARSGQVTTSERGPLPCWTRLLTLVIHTVLSSLRRLDCGVTSAVICW